MKPHSKINDSDTTEYLKFIAVLLSISAVSWVLYLGSDQGGVFEFMRWFMGVFLVVFAGFKLSGYKMFVTMFQGYDLVARKLKPYALAYPFVELALGVMFLAEVLPLTRNLVLFIIMSIGTVGVFQEVYRRKSGIHCACLGNIIKLPLSTVSLVENLTMAVMAAIMIFKLSGW